MKVVHCKKEKYDIYIGRPSIWGNPYSWESGTLAKYKVDTRLQAIIMFKWHLINSPLLLEELAKLKGNEILGCWCNAERDDCHGNAIMEIYEWLKSSPQAI